MKTFVFFLLFSGFLLGSCTNPASTTPPPPVILDPTTLPPAPSLPATNVQCLWNSSQTYPDLPFTTDTTNLADVTVAGKVLKLLTLASTQTLTFSPALNASGMTYLHLSYWTSLGNDLSIDLTNATTDTFSTPGAVVTFGDLNKNQWTDLEVPVPAVFDLSTLQKITFTNEAQAGSKNYGSSATFYLDNVYLHNYPSTSTELSSTGDPWYGGNLVWDDEFNGNSINPANWTYDLGGGGWGNNELETYTTTNASIQTVPDGNNLVSCLVITAQRDASGNWTSSRLNTQGLQNFTYGKIEARIKLPYGNGMWPAFWMLGSNLKQVGWPNCGETDILEMIGGNGSPSPGTQLSDSTVYGTIHWYNSSSVYPYASFQPEKFSLSTGKFADAFHTFGIIWNSTSITYYIDGKPTASVTPDKTTGSTFQQPFFLILNLAVGGDWPGPPNSSTVSPQTMDVDWVRVYQ